ncbi:MAG: hypothetical protein GY765_43615 [bacterium]|nr:hypothetical protein [bacterium]
MKRLKGISYACILSALLFSLPAVNQLAAADLQDLPDSIRYILDMQVEGRTRMELSGEEVTEFRFYTTTSYSCVVWKYRKEFYVYSFNDDRHVSRAGTVFKLLKENGLSTFVALRDVENKRLSKYHKVLAIKIK